MTTKEIADAVKNEPMLSGRLFDSPIVKNYLKAVGVVKYNKTILSPGTHGKNVIGNLFFMAMNGYTDPAAYTRAFAEARGRMKALELDELSERYDKLLRLGVVDQSVAVRELNAMFGEEDVEKHIQTILERRQGAFSAEDMLKMSGWVKGAKALKKNVLNPSQNAYQLEDDYFKLVSFDIESNRLAQLRYKKDYSQLSEKEMQEIDLEAAETTKNLLPNYSRIGQLGLMMKAVPVFGTFISFQLESYRTAYNTIDLALKEIKDPAKRRIGAKRLVGTAAVQFINHYALASLGKMLVPGTDPDDEEQNEFIKLVLPTWAKNSEKVLVAAEPGKFTYIDLSASNPHGQMERAMNAVLKGTDPKDAAYEFFMEAFGPFVSEDITFATMKRIVTNSNSYGGELIKTDDTPMEQFEKVFMELYRAAEPGIARSATKIYKSDNKLFEFLGQMTGYKPQTVDYRKQMEFTSREINQEVRSLSKYSKAKREYNDGKITLEELDQQFRNNEQNKLKIYGRAMKLYRGALHFGVSPVDAREAMKKGGIPVYIIDQIENGNLEYVRR